MRIIDLFAGPGGWDEGLAQLGEADVTGYEWDQAACDTAEAAGHVRVKADIAALDPHGAAGEDVEGVIGSPPCPGFSAAGKGLGRLDLAILLTAIRRIGNGEDPNYILDQVRGVQHDERSALTLEPLRWVMDLEPDWVALEQVPTVLPLWEGCAEVLRADGYSVWTGNLQAEQYGVPQTRRRAVLLASRSEVVLPPLPTHSRYYPRSPEKLDTGVQKWVSMAAALNWGMTERPSMTVTGGGTSTGGAEPFGNAARQGMRREFEAGHWATRRPSTTIVGSFKPEIVAAPGYRTKVSRQNAPGSVRVTVQEAAVLQSFRPDYPWQGKQGKQFQQVGNAIPPLLAAHCLSALGVGLMSSEVAA